MGESGTAAAFLPDFTGVLGVVEALMAVVVISRMEPIMEMTWPTLDSSEGLVVTGPDAVREWERLGLMKELQVLSKLNVSSSSVGGALIVARFSC
jgi:hypothetical protein